MHIQAPETLGRAEWQSLTRVLELSRRRHQEKWACQRQKVLGGQLAACAVPLLGQAAGSLGRAVLAQGCRELLFAFFLNGA